MVFYLYTQIRNGGSGIEIEVNLNYLTTYEFGERIPSLESIVSHIETFYFVSVHIAWVTANGLQNL